MQNPATTTSATLDTVIVTDELTRRPAKRPNLAAEHSAFTSLARELAISPSAERLLQRLCEEALEMCGAGSAGISLIEQNGDQEVFRWVAMAGAYAEHVGGTTPRSFSPCGACLERGAPQLYKYPQRFFTYFAEVAPPIVEGLVIPFSARGRDLGTIWIVTHDELQRGFDAEDVRVMQSLADFTAVALEALLASKREEELHQEAEVAGTYGRIFFESADAILVADENGRYLDANQSAQTMLGYSRSEFVAMHVPDLVAADKTWTEQYRRLVAEGHWRGEIEVRRKDGEIVPVEAHATIVNLPTGPAYVSTLRDISERRSLERLQQEFLTAVGHELRSPLTPIIGLAQVLLRLQRFDPEALQEILSQSRRLQRLIGDLLDASRLQTGHFHLKRVDFELRHFVESMVEAAQTLSSSHTFSFESPAYPLFVTLDQDRVGQILENLLSNAVKYSPRGGEIKVRIEEMCDEVRISVSDQGIGIEAESLAELFGRFYRTEVARSVNIHGLGLGLFIVKMLAEAHGGRVSVESPGRDKGSTFSVILPKQPKHEPGID